MPISGLLLTLSSDPDRASEALEHLQRRPGIELGDARGRWLPIATETSDSRSAREVHHWLESLPGIAQVEVIYVSFDEPVFSS